MQASASHARRLEREGWLERCPMVGGDGSLFRATRKGIRVLGLAVIAASTTAPTTWAHDSTCAWTAAWLNLRGRTYLDRGRSYESSCSTRSRSRPSRPSRLPGHRRSGRIRDQHRAKATCAPGRIASIAVGRSSRLSQTNPLRTRSRDAFLR